MLEAFALVAFFVVAFALIVRQPQSGLRRRAAFRRFPRSSIGEAEDGQSVRVEGIVLGDPSLVAPISGTTCCWYSARIMSAADGASRSVYDEGGSDLLVRDQNMHAFIPRAHVDAMLHLPWPGAFTKYRELNPGAKALLQERLADKRGVGNTWWVAESIIRLGDRVVVAGRGTWRQEPDLVPLTGGTFREPAASKVLVFAESRVGKVLLTNARAELRDPDPQSPSRSSDSASR